MWWPFNRRLLLARGILGINRRNAECILDRNPRSLFPVVDDKLAMADLCRRIGVPTPAIVGVIQRHGELCDLERILIGHDDLVIKPARGSGGRGVLVLAKDPNGRFRKANGRSIDGDSIQRHVADILSGRFSLGSKPDRAILQHRVRLHPSFRGIAPHGIPDIRLVVYRFEMAMAMLRLPTLESNGRANLHQGGLGVGIETSCGRTHRAIYRDRRIERHPDTGEPLLDRAIPHWDEIVEMAVRVSRAIGLGFVGIDIVIDEREGPMLLEANARPGLAIQLANDGGLAERMEAIDSMAD